MLLNRYIFREILIPTLIALLALTFIVFTRELGSFLDLIVRRSANWSEVRAIAMAVLPNVLIFSIPMAVLVGILTGFGRLSSDHEAVAFRAVGLSMMQILRPVLALAVLAWVINLGLALWIAPAAAARLQDLKYSIGLKLVSLELRPRVFDESLANLVLYVQDISSDGTRWRGILLADTSNPNETRLTFARTGTFGGDPGRGTMQVTLVEGSTHILSPLQPDKYSYSRFRNTTIPIPLPAPPPRPERADAHQLSTGDLWSRVQSGAAAYEERVEFQRRLALPFACIAFALVGLPLGVSTRRGGKSMGLVISLLLMLVYYLVFIGGTRIANNAQLPPVLGSWAANLGFMILGAVLLFRSDREYTNKVVDWIGEKVSSLRSLFSPAGWVRRIAGRWASTLTHHPKWFRLLDAYILRGFWFFFLLVLAVFVSLFVIVTLFELLPDIVKNNVGAGVVGRYFFYLLPQILYYVVPLTVLLAILIDLGVLAKNNEVLAVKAGAISIYRLSLPLLAVGLTVSAAVYLLQDFLLPYANQRQDEFRNIIKGRAQQTYRHPDRKWMVGSDNRIYNYNFFDPLRNVLGGLSVFEFNPTTFDLERWTFAARAEWDSPRRSEWVLEDGWTRTRRDENGLAYEPFQAMAFRDMRDGPEYFEKEVRTAAQMTYLELKRYVADMEHSGFDVSALSVDLYRKLSFPFVPFIMAVIGIPFSLTTGKRGAFYGIGLCVIIGITYWGTFEFFDKLGGVSRLSPVVAAWFPNLIFGTSGLWMMLRIRT